MSILWLGRIYYVYECFKPSYVYVTSVSIDNNRKAFMNLAIDTLATHVMTGFTCIYTWIYVHI